MSPAQPTPTIPLGPNTWIFQANPTKYKINEALANLTEDLWNLNQHAKRVRRGDRALIWISGRKEAGIYAVGTIKTDPVLQADSPTGQQLWIDKRQGRMIKPRVLVGYDRWLLGRPLSKMLLRTDPDLAGLAIFRFPRGTIFPVTPDEWTAIEAWLEDDGSPPT
jgi:5-methylcytosine-specific restriction enzyme A